MAGGSRFIWIPVLLSCVFPASDNRHVYQDVNHLIGQTGNPEVGRIISSIPITLPEGFNPTTINETSITIKTCTGMKEQLAQLTTQLQQTTLRNSQLGNEAFGSRREIRQLKLQLAACSSTASAIAGSYRAQLLTRMNQLLETFDSDTFLILKMIALTREVKTLQKKVKHAANSTETTDIQALQTEQQQKFSELTAKTQQMERSHANSALILQIITLQNKIWDLEQAESRRAETNPQPDKRILALQTQLDGKISELRSKGDADSAMLELIFVHSKIAAMTRLISNHIEESRTKAADYQRQLRQKAELLKRKISRLTREENNKNLTKEILMLQAEVEHLEQFLINAKKTTDFQLKELRVSLENEKKQQENLQKHLEEADYAQAQLILKIISLMKEVRELNEDQQQQTSTSQATTLQTLLQAKEREFAKAQEEINELQRTLKLKMEECSDVEERYQEVKTEFEQKIAELNRSGNSKAALILSLKLQEELKTLRDQISITQDPDRIAELQVQVEEKQRELNSKTAFIESLSPNSTILLTVTELHNLLRSLQNKKPNDEATSSLTVSQLRERLEITMAEHSRDQAEIKVLQSLLQTNEREHAVAQAEVRELQRKLRLKIEECSGVEERYEKVKTEFEQKIAELNRSGGSRAALILNVINLHEELKTLRDQISTTQDPDRIAELQRQLEEKEDQLNAKTADIERLIPNPRIISTIIELQNEIWDLQKTAANESTSDVKDLQNRVDDLIRQIDDKGDDNTKLMLKMITLRSQVEQLQRQLSDLQTLRVTQVTKLTNDLTTKRDELQKYVNELNQKNQTNTRLILETTDLHNQLRNLEKEKQIEGQKSSAAVTELREQLKAREQQHFNDRAVIEDLQKKLNQTEEQCSSFEQKLKDLQNDLDAKMKELQSGSESVTSLALQVSTLTVQVEELKKQLQNTDSETKIKELQKMIDEKNNELAKKTEELKARSAQPRRILQIITIQTEIEKLVNVAANDTDYIKIKAHQDRLNSLVEGIQDDNNENTKLMFKILAQQDEIARLEKQEKSQTQAVQEKIKDLENELEDIRSQIKEKTAVLDSSDTRIANLTAQIMELHQKIKPLENEIAALEYENAENVRELQKDLDVRKRQLQDLESLLKDADRMNSDLIMEIAGLRTQLKKAQKKASEASEKDVEELEQQLQTQERENRRLENANKALKQEIKELEMCCADDNTQCDDLQRQLLQSQEDADRLQQQLLKKNAMLNQLQQELEEQSRDNNNTLQQENNNLRRQLQQTQTTTDDLQQQLNKKNAALNQLQQELEDQRRENDKLEREYNNYFLLQQKTQRTTDDLQQQLNEKNATLNQLQQELEDQRRENHNLQEDYTNLLEEKNKLEADVRDLQNKLSDVEDKTIYTTKTILDPNTAHPRVALSADNTEMSTSEEIKDVPDLPGRFDAILAVLGKTGYSSGRHYWEVSVAGKLCFHLGMASESSQRKGAVIFTPARGFWTVVLNKQGQYKALDRRHVIIQAQTQPVTLGILLDYKKGQISFYDAGSRSHMYSFVGQKFTDKIYPFINFCVEDDGSQTPVVLLSPGSTDWIK